MMGQIDKKIAEMGIVLPEPLVLPGANRTSAVLVADRTDFHRRRVRAAADVERLPRLHPRRDNAVHNAEIYKKIRSAVRD